MDAIILCGGRGTRLSGLYGDRPKALAPVAGRPFIEWQLRWLWRGGVERLHLAAGHLAGQLRAWLAQSPEAARCTLSVEPSPLGTGGGLKFAAACLPAATLLVVNGDTLAPRLAFAALLAAHRAGGALLTLGVAPIADAGRYGTVEFDAQRRVTAFREKAERTAGWINAGVYLAERALLERIPAGRPVSLETEAFPALAREGQIAAFPVEPPLLDMGTPEGLREMDLYLQGPEGRKLLGA